MLVLVLTVVWLLWSGLTLDVAPGESPPVTWNGLLAFFMVASVAVTIAVVNRMDTVDHESTPAHLALRGFVYGPWLLKEIALSNWHVAQVVLGWVPIHPQLVRVRTTQKGDLGHVIHANSITITPGTVSLDVRSGSILVHALTDDTAAGVLSGEMDRRVTWLEGSPERTR